MVPPPSCRIPRVPHYSGYRSDSLYLKYRTFTFFGPAFLPCSSIKLSPYICPYPRDPKTSGLGSFPFARRYSENRVYFLFLRLLRCFSSPGSLHYTMYSCNDNVYLYTLRSRIRTSVGRSSLTALHSFSQLATSFFGAWYLGIHRMLFVA